MIRTLSDKATLMGLEFGALDRMGMNQDPPPLIHTQSTGLRCSVTEKKKKEKKKEREKKSGRVAIPEVSGRGRTGQRHSWSEI